MAIVRVSKSPQTLCERDSLPLPNIFYVVSSYKYNLDFDQLNKTFQRFTNLFSEIKVAWYLRN